MSDILTAMALIGGVFAFAGVLIVSVILWVIIIDYFLGGR